MPTKFHDRAAKINLFYAQDEWLISPTINLGSNSNVTRAIQFDIALTNLGATTQGTPGDYDTAAFLISYDNGVTWNHSGIIEVWDTSNVPSAAGDNFIYNLMNTSGLVKFGFYVGTFASNANNDWFIDNFRINDTIYYWGVDEIN